MHNNRIFVLLQGFLPKGDRMLCEHDLLTLLLNSTVVGVWQGLLEKLESMERSCPSVACFSPSVWCLKEFSLEKNWEQLCHNVA